MASVEGTGTPTAPSGPVISSISLVHSAPHELVVAWTVGPPPALSSTSSSVAASPVPSPPAMHPGAVACQYHVQYSPRYLGRWLEWDESYTVPIARLSGLADSNRYNVRVRAKGVDATWGPWSVASTDLWTTGRDGAHTAQRSQHASAQLRRFESCHANVVAKALGDEALDTSNVVILGPLLPAACLAVALGITPVATEALDDAASAVSTSTGATMTQALGPPVGYWFRRTRVPAAARSNATVRTSSRSCDRCGEALGAAGVGRVRLCEECGRFLCGRCRCASVFHDSSASTGAGATPYRALRTCVECAMKAVGEMCSHTCATVCVPDSGHELHVLCESATLALVRSLTRVKDGDVTTLVMPHDTDSSSEEDDEHPGAPSRTHGTHDWHWAAMSRMLLSSSAAPMTASSLSLPTARRDRFVTVPICVCAANGHVYLPSPDVHPCRSFRDALAETSTQLEYMTLLNDTGASSCTHMRVHRELQPYSRARGHDDVDASVATVYPCLQLHNAIEVIPDAAAFFALSRVNVCSTAASVTHVSGWIRQAHTDVVREPGVVLEVDTDSSAAFLAHASSHGLELQPLAAGDAPWLGTARTPRSTSAAANTAAPCTTCMYAPMGSDEHVCAYVCAIAATVSRVIRYRWRGVLALVDDSVALHKACIAAGVSDDDAAVQMQERVQALVHTAVSAAVTAAMTAIIVCSSRTQAGGDAHAIAHEIYGTGNRSESGEPRRSLVVLKHVQPSAWGACDLAPEHTQSRAPVRIGIAGMESIMLETVDLYAVLDMNDLEGNVWAYIQPVVTHKLVWRDGTAEASVNPPDSDATSPRNDAPAPSAAYIVQSLIQQCMAQSSGAAGVSLGRDTSRTLRFSSRDTTPPTSPSRFASHASNVDPVLQWLLATHTPQLMDAYRVCTCPPAGRSPGETVAHIVDVSQIGALTDALTHVHDNDDGSPTRRDAASSTPTATSPFFAMMWGSDMGEKQLAVRDHLHAAVLRELERMGVTIPNGEDVHVALADNLNGAALDESVGWKAAVALGMGSGVTGMGFRSTPASRRGSPISTPTPSARALRFGTNSPAGASTPTPSSSPGRVYAIIRAGSREVETASHAVQIDGRSPFACIPRWNEGARFIWDGTSALTLSLWYTTATGPAEAGSANAAASGGICLGSVAVSLMALERGVPVRVVLPVTIRVHTRVKVPLVPQPPPPRRETGTTTVSSSSLTDPAPEVDVDSVAAPTSGTASKRWSKVRTEALKALDAAKRRARARTHFVGSGPIDPAPVSFSSLLSTQNEPFGGSAPLAATPPSGGIYDVYVDLVSAHVRVELYYYPRAVVPHTPAAHLAREAKRAAKRAKKRAAAAAAAAPHVAPDSDLLSLDLNDMIAGRITRESDADVQMDAVLSGTSEADGEVAPAASPRV